MYYIVIVTQNEIFCSVVWISALNCQNKYKRAMGHDTVLNIVQLYNVQCRVQLVLMLLSACFLDQEPFFSGLAVEDSKFSFGFATGSDKRCLWYLSLIHI